MKTRIFKIRSLGVGLVSLFLLLISVSGYSQACPGNSATVSIGNFAQTSNTIEYDVFVTNTSANPTRFSSYGGNVIYNAGMIPAGATYTVTVVDQPNAEQFPGVSAAPVSTANSAQAGAITARSLRWTFNPAITPAASAPLIAQGVTLKFARFRVTSSLPWTPNFAGSLAFNHVSAGGNPIQVVNVYCNTNVGSTSLTILNGLLTTSTGSAQQTPFTFVLNPQASCPTAAAAGSLVAESPCAGAANGSAVITLTGAPNNSSPVTYTVDGGATQNATLSAGAFTVNGLSAGSHVVAVTYPSCSPVSTSSFTIDAGAPLTTNGSVTTSICDGDTYVWPANGASYTTEQVGTTFVSGCNTATLNLSITPATTTGSESVSVCGTSYTWATSGQTYNASGSYDFVVGCNTATLTLTLTPNTTTGSESVSVCGTSYTWATSGATYNASGSYDFVVGCNTATLTLTLTPSTTIGDETVEACGTSYTWATSGLSYNASGVYPFVSGCNTATLTLTLNTVAETFYADTDGDGFGAGAAIESCTGQPEGTSTNNTDCAPSDPTRWRTGTFFVDADNDGYNNGFPASSVCYGATTPSGFVAVNNGVDCDENSASVNPNASEVAANGIDDNCDGTVDEVTALSSLVAASCGATLTSLESAIFAYPLSSFPEVGTIQGYRFRVTNGPTVRTIDRPSNSFALSQLAGGATYATTYTVEVSVKSNGFFRGYGPACSVTTPAVPSSTFISSPACGSTLADISNSIFCVQVPSASGYRFRVRNGATVVGTVDKTVNRFSLVELGISNIAFATTYTVDVLLAFGGNLRPESEYGSACSISTPATPGTSRVIAPSCGSTINALWTTIFAQQVLGAQGYKFVVTNGVQTREFATANPRFQLPLLAGGAAASTAYTIRVDVLYASSYVQGTVLCTITTSPTATRQTSAALAIYEVNAYPNPYAETFKLNVNTSSEDQVGVRVYDMLGREVEARQASVAAITNLEIGSQYPSGVYNIIVTQGSNVKTVRVVKR